MLQKSIKSRTFRVNLIFCRFFTRWQSKQKTCRLAGFFMPEKRYRTLNALVIVNTGLSACWLFRQELLVCHVNQKREKDMLKQQDMTETARVVFNELSVTEPATVGEIAQNTYLSRERCQLILTQLVMAGLADYQFGCYRRLPQ